MSTVLKEMYNNLNYYYKLTDPLHNNKNYEEQYQLITDVSKNLTFLSQDMDDAKEGLIEIERNLHDRADQHFRENDKNMHMDENTKNDLFDDDMAEVKLSLNLARNKFKIIDEKVE